MRGRLVTSFSLCQLQEVSSMFRKVLFAAIPLGAIAVAAFLIVSASPAKSVPVEQVQLVTDSDAVAEAEAKAAADDTTLVASNHSSGSHSSWSHYPRSSYPRSSYPYYPRFTPTYPRV